MKRTLRHTSLLLTAPLLAAVAALAVSTLAAPPTAANAQDSKPATYALTGDEGGSKFEGIGTDEKRGRFYVSEVTGGEIHRGTTASPTTREWLAGDGTDGRFTARGITTDAAGNVLIAGGPNGIGEDGRDNGRPDFWVYSRTGKLLASLKAPGDNAFLNDVWIGPDGAAYVTDSNSPRIFRVTQTKRGWAMRLWVDASKRIRQADGFNLGGIVATADASALVVAQGNVGKLWRFDLRTKRVSRVRTGDADLLNADGLVLEGNRLTVVRNFSKAITTLRLTSDGRSATLIRDRASDPTRVLTTAKPLAGRILYVDSKFDETVAAPPYEVITDPFGNGS